MDADPRQARAVKTHPPHSFGGAVPGPAARRMPEPAEHRGPEDLAEALRRFHLTGEAQGLGAAEQALPAALASVIEQQADRAPWPVFVEEQAAAPRVRPLREVLIAAHAALQKSGRLAPALTAHFSALLGAALEALLDGAAAGGLGAYLLQAGKAYAEASGLSEADARALAADLEALARHVPPGVAFGLTPDAPVRLVVAAVHAARQPLRAAFAAQVERVREGLAELILLDDLARRGREAEVLAGTLGPAGRLLDLSALARTLGSQRAAEPLPEARRARIEALLGALASAPLPGADLALFAEAALPAIGRAQGSVDADPLAAAARRFDEVAAKAAGLFRVVRRAALEIDGRYDPSSHDAALKLLDWHGFTAQELGALQPIAAVVSAERLRGRDAATFAALQRSGRPVIVVSVERPGEPGGDADLSSFHTSLGLQGVAHRETFVLQAGLARPALLAERLTRLGRALRPSLAVIAAPTDGVPSLRAGRAEAALLGRALPELTFDPDAGSGWAQRFELLPDQVADQAWTLRRLAYQAAGGEASLEVPLTFADAVGLDPAYRRHFCVAPRAAWTDDLVPLVDWLAQLEAPLRGVAAAARARTVPYVWVLGEGGQLQRAAVTRALALATRDRQRAWRMIQELAGFEAAQRVLAEARGQAEAELRARVEKLEAAHKAELEAVKKESLRAAMIRLASALTGLGAPATMPRAAVPEAAPSAQVPAAKGSNGAAPAAAQAPAAAPAPVEEAWIDTALCTSCNDCIKVNRLMFVYNAEKQATIGDVSKGTWAEMVKAAEACPAKCIHPGKPRAGDATATPELIARGEKLN